VRGNKREKKKTNSGNPAKISKELFGDSPRKRSGFCPSNSSDMGEGNVQRRVDKKRGKSDVRKREKKNS